MVFNGPLLDVYRFRIPEAGVTWPLTSPGYKEDAAVSNSKVLSGRWEDGRTQITNRLSELSIYVNAFNLDGRSTSRTA
jgi:hypothetical protein